MQIRRGISLIEVLFSVGVVGIGLLGVLTLVPVAITQIGKGNDNDRTSRMGLNSLAEFEIRGMSNIDNWRYYSSGFFPVYPPLTPQFSFAIDPLALSLSGNQNAPGSVFPANGSISMVRYSLRSLPMPYAPAMSALHADRIFILRDELVFNVSKDVSVPPSQVFNWDQGPDGQWGASGIDDDANGTADDGTEAGWVGTDDLVTTRQTDGVYSWMATMTPKLDSRNPTAYPDNFAGDYVLSIVVFRNRDFNVTNGISERVVDVSTIYGDGTGGGDMLLTPLSTSTTAAEDLLGVREGNWIMLSCMLPMYGGAATNTNYFAWYRVDSVDDEPDTSTGTTTLDVSLSGPDWPLGWTVKPGGVGTGTQAALVKNVIAVYQKVVHLETSSLWSE